MTILATEGTGKFLAEAGIASEPVLKLHEGRPNMVDMILNGQVDLVVNTPSSSTESAHDDSYIRKAAIKAHVPYMTTMAAAKATALGIQVEQSIEEPEVRSLQEIHGL